MSEPPAGWPGASGHQPGLADRDRPRASEVEITFTQLTPERTRVVLTHRHLDRHGEGWEGMRDAVSSGWSLEGFAKAAEQPFSGLALGQPLPPVTDATMQTRLAAAKAYTAMVLRTTASYARPAHDPLIREHGRRNMALVEAGLLAVVLPATDASDVAGYGVFTTDLDGTRRVMDADPGVRAGIFTYELHPMLGFPRATLP